MIGAVSRVLVAFALLAGCGRSGLGDSDQDHSVGSPSGRRSPILTGSLARPRYGHTATLLPSGEVLIAGGCGAALGPDRVLARAELYDPKTETFRAVRSMETARAYHRAILLPTGEVLIVGGFIASGLVAKAEIYASEQFTSVGAMVSGRYRHQATLLSDGRVLVTGGYDEDNQPRLVAELYDPATGEFTLTGTMSTARYDHTATLLPNGKILVAGGRSTKGYLSSAELYDPAIGAFVAAANMMYERWQYTATSLGNGKMLVAGGSGKEGIYTFPYFDRAELYDPGSGTFGPAGSMRIPRNDHTATLLSDEEVFIAGGFGGDYGEVLADTEIYNLAQASFSVGVPMAIPRMTHTATRLANGRVLVAGGQSGADILSSAELY